MRSRSSRNRGLTLLELIVAAAFVAVLSGTAIVQWAHLQDGFALHTGAWQVMLDLLAVRVRAAATNSTHRVVFPSGADAYVAQVRQGGTYTATGPPVALPRGVRILRCNATGQAITFRPRGNAATFGTIVLQNRAGRERSVIVDIAGRVRFQ